MAAGEPEQVWKVMHVISWHCHLFQRDVDESHHARQLTVAIPSLFFDSLFSSGFLCILSVSNAVVGIRGKVVRDMGVPL